MAVRICQDHPPTCLNRDVQHPDELPFYVTPLLRRNCGGTGILTRFPLATLFSLALGADLP